MQGTEGHEPLAQSTYIYVVLVRADQLHQSSGVYLKLLFILKYAVTLK